VGRGVTLALVITERRNVMAIGVGQGKGGGPRTEEGKMRVSQNALKHGFRAEAPHTLNALDYEPGAEFEPMLEKAKEYFQPTNPMEDDLVQVIARCWWKRARLQQLEDRCIERNPFKLLPVNSGTNLLKYGRQVDLQLHRALRALDRMRGRKSG
jgi:hypothetical protein